MKSNETITPISASVLAEISDLPAEEQAGLMEAWIVAGDVPTDGEVGKSAAWSAIRSRLQFDVEPDRAPLSLVLSTMKPLLPRPWAVAATLLLLVASVVLLGNRDIRLEAPIGEQLVTEVILPDGSTVQMSPGTELQYPRAFGEETRRVVLDGEAFFDVQHAGIPFVVETASAQVEVLGTAFNVRSWESASELSTLVFLQRGSVRVSSDDFPTMAVRLSPGEATNISAGELPLPPYTTSEDAALTWREGGFSFTNARIGDVLDEVSRRFNVRVRAIEDIRVGRITYYRHTSAAVEVVLGDIADAAGLRFRRIANGYEVIVP